VVSTPSPIVRGSTARPLRAAQHHARAPPPASAARARRGDAATCTLPIVVDQFATVTVVPNEELRRSSGGTLATCFLQAGITGSSFAPGASSRPIVRGLDVNRVGMSRTASAPTAPRTWAKTLRALDPLSTNQLEVIRVPRPCATARSRSRHRERNQQSYPRDLPCAGPPQQPFLGTPGQRPCVTFESRGAFDTASTAEAPSCSTPAATISPSTSTLCRKSDDYRVPHYPYLTPPNPADVPFATQPGQFSGRQPNSAAQSDGTPWAARMSSAKASWRRLHRNNSLYQSWNRRDGHQTHIEAHQDKFTAKASGATSLRRRRDSLLAGATDYKHNEVGLADTFDLLSSGVRQTFTNKEQEARVEVQLLPINLQFATLTTALGVQVGISS